MTAWRENAYSTVALGQPPLGRAALAGAAREITAPSPDTRTIVEPRMIIIEPQPHHYAEMARRILRKTKRTVGIVLSVVEVVPADGRPMIDTRIVHGRFRPRLANPPAHVVLPAEVYEIAWEGMTFRYVWILSNERSAFPTGGILFLPPQDGAVFFMVTFNVGALDDGRCTNVHHAEMQAVRWINEQPRPWRARVGGIGIWNLSRSRGLGYSPCNACCCDLARFLTHLRARRPRALAMKIRATINWLTLYDKNRACGHPTDTANLRRLAGSGWELRGPGWPPGRPAAACPGCRQRTP
jgi:hypothetical protein